MTQYEVKLPQEDAGQEPMTLTLSRPLPKNRLVVLTSEGAEMFPVAMVNEKGEFRGVAYPFGNNEGAMILFVYYDYRHKDTKIRFPHWPDSCFQDPAQST